MNGVDLQQAHARDRSQYARLGRARARRLEQALCGQMQIACLLNGDWASVKNFATILRSRHTLGLSEFRSTLSRSESVLSKSVLVQVRRTLNSWRNGYETESFVRSDGFHRFSRLRRRQS